MTEAMEPATIAISRLDDGQWGWDVFYDEDVSDKGGIERTLEEALEALMSALFFSPSTDTHTPSAGKR